jgi:hypothetical protein
MESRDNKGDEHGVGSSTVVHGASDQGSSSFAAVKCQNSQVPSTGSRIESDPGGYWWPPPFPTGLKQFSGKFGNLLFLAVFNF